MRRGPRVTFIIATIVSAAIAAWLAAVPAHAVQGTITVSRPGASNVICSFGSAAATSVNLDTACGTVLAGGNVQITDKVGTTGAQAAALGGTSQNQLVIRNIVLKNLGTSAATITIDANHTFPGVNTNVARNHGFGNNASFSRKNAQGVTILAKDNKLEKRGFYTYFDPSPNCIAPAVLDTVAPVGCRDEIATFRSYTVPPTGSTSQNTIPIPSQTASENNRQCSDLTSSGTCATGERLRTLVTVVLTQTNDLVTIPGGDHTVAGDAGDNFVNAVLGSLSLVARLHQNTPNSRVNPNDNGHLTVELLCNPDFLCEFVHQTSLRFGPGGAIPKSVKLKDVNGDGSDDLQIKVRQPDTGIVCGDTSATLTGTADFPGFGDVDFDAIVGFYTGPGCPLE